MRITDAVVVDKEFRLYRKAITLSERIRRMMQYHSKNSATEYGPAYERRARKVLQAIDPETQPKTATGEINYSLSSRKILKAPVKETIEEIFRELRQPSARQKPDLIAELMDTLGEKAKVQRCATYKWLLALEIAYRTKQNAYMIFNTLTVAPGEYYKVFNKDSTAFKEYIRKVDKLTEGHTYFGVVEEGAENGRLHIHVLHFMDKLPKGSEDPNTHVITPTRRELNTFKALWPYGFSSPIIVRYSPNDAYGRTGYRWPYNTKEGKSQKIGSPLRIASYMSKYIVKSYTSNKRSKLLWRIRKTQKLGMAIMEELTSQLETETLLIVATTNRMTTRWNNWRIPPILLRQTALREVQKRNQNNHQNTKKITSDAKITEMAKQLKPRLAIGHSQRDLDRTIQENNQQSIGFLQTIGINKEETFKRAYEDFARASGEIRAKYFEETTATYGTTTTRDYIHTTAS